MWVWRVGEVGGGAGGDDGGLLQGLFGGGTGDRHDGARCAFADAQRPYLQGRDRYRRGVGNGGGAAEHGGQHEGSERTHAVHQERRKEGAHQKVTLACTPTAHALSVRV